MFCLEIWLGRICRLNICLAAKNIHQASDINSGIPSLEFDESEHTNFHKVPGHSYHALQRAVEKLSYKGNCRAADVDVQCTQCNGAGNPHQKL